MITRLTLAIGALLTLTGVVAYAATHAGSLTALIPSAVGVLLLVAGWLARDERMRRHAIHGALAVALLGVLGSVMNTLKLGQVFDGTAERPGAIIASAVMCVLLVAYLVVGVRSFVAARRTRQA